MPTFKNRQEYEAWKATRKASTVPRPPAVSDRSGSDWSTNYFLARDAGQKMILMGFVLTCLGWLQFWSGNGFNGVLSLLGPFMISFGCRILIYKPEIPVRYLSICDTLWCLAGIGFGGLSYYAAGILAPESPVRTDAFVHIVIFTGGIIIGFIYSLIAQRRKRPLQNAGNQ